MVNFLLQTENGKLVHDFTFALWKSMEYHDWLNDAKSKNPFNVEYCEYSEDLFRNYYPHSKHYLNSIPVGSIKFVLEHLDVYFNKKPKPLNIPEELMKHEFTQRKVINGNENDVIGNVFFKSNDSIKGYQNVNDPSIEIPKGNYQISEIIDIESEWRTFVYQGEIVGLQPYSGDFLQFPDVSKIADMIYVFESAPIAYTLDVAITSKHKTVIMEVHDFFSCGLYSFNNQQVLPYMYSRWWYYYTNNLKYDEK